MRRLLLTLVIPLCFCFHLQAQSFNFPMFTGAEPVTMNSSAALVGSTVRLAPATNSAKGSMFHNTQLTVANGFDTTFTFSMNGGNGADGMAFVIHNDPRGAGLITDHGSSMGYAHFATSAPGTGALNALAIELDTYASSFNGFMDLGPNEISVHTNGIQEISHGEDQSIGRVAPAINLNDGATHTLRVLYTPGTLDIFLDGAATPTLSVPYDFATGSTHILTSNAVGGLNLAAGAAWVGFTGACGGLNQNHDVLSWSFTSTAVLPDDVAVSNLTSPTNNSTNCSPLSNSEVVTVDFRNAGMNPISAGAVIPVSFQVDGTTPVTEFFVAGSQISSGAGASYTFTATADLSAVGTHTITVSSAYSLDMDATNDTLVRNISSGGQLRVTSYPFVEDFSSVMSDGGTLAPLGFINDQTDASGPNSDWFMRRNSTPTAGTGPNADHTTGVSGSGGYTHVDDDGNYAAVNLISPCFDLSGLVNPTLRFFLWSENSASSTVSNQMSVDVISYPSGTITMDVFGPQGETGSNWGLQAVDLSPFAGQVVQVVFRADTATVTSNTHDLALDDISVSDLLATPGQAPQDGLAVLDMNGPRNINGDPLQFGFGGPYFATLSTNDTLVLRMEGQANQPILLFSGPLNPVAATFQGVGKMDLGGPVDPFTGIPSMLSIVANGGAPGLFNSLFMTSPTGEAELGFTVPALPPGVLGNFQCALLNNVNGASLSNSVQLIIM